MNHKIEPSAETLRKWALLRYELASCDWGIRAQRRIALAKTFEVLDEIDALLNGQAREECCVWHEDESGEFWSGSCGVDWCFIDGGPVENKMHFCPGKSCGKPVRVADNETGGG